MAMNTVNILENSNGKLTEKQKGTNGAAHVRAFPGPQTQSHNRELVAVNTTVQTCTWVAAENVTELTIVATWDAGVVTIAAPADGVFVCFDATSDALAAVWLTEASHPADDSNRYFIPLNTPRTFRFTDSLLRMDAKINADGETTAANIIVEAN